MSFRKFGGLQYAAKHNIVSSNYNTSNNLLVTEKVGQPNSNINFESDIYLDGNLHILATGPTGSSSNNGIYFPDGSFQNTAASSSGEGINGVTGIYSDGLENGAQITTTRYLQLGAATQDYPGVVTTGTQTFSGSKSFSVDISVQGLRLGLGGQTSGTANPYNTAFGYYALSKTSSSSSIANNVAIGYQSLKKTTTGTDNVSVGANSLMNNTGGSYNIGIGSGALAFNADSSHNTAIGYNALYNNTSGYWNLAIGTNSLYSIQTSSNNIAIGYKALYWTTIGGNLAVGNNALYSNSSGYYNLGIGSGALFCNTTGLQNAGIGLGSLYKNDSGSNNVAFGMNSLYNNETGSNNVAIGYNAGPTGTNKAALSNSIAIGYNAPTTASNTIQMGNSDIIQMNTSGTIGVGTYSTDASASGIAGSIYYNTTDDVLKVYDGSTWNSIGLTGVTSVTSVDNDGFANGAQITSENYLQLGAATENYPGVVTTGTQSFAGSKSFISDISVNTVTIGLGNGSNSRNIVFGNKALYNNTELALGGNVAVGTNSLYSNTSGYRNTAIGENALYSTTTGFNNLGIGVETLYYNTIGIDNIAIGYKSLRYNDSSNNSAIGPYSLQNNTSGHENTCLGHSSLYSNTTGSYNTGIGFESLYKNITGDKNVAIGYYAGPSTGNTNLSNSIAIGYEASTSASNTIQMGNSDIIQMNTSGTIGVGTYSTDASASGIAGSIYYNTTDDVLKVYDGSTWSSIGSGGSGVTGPTGTIAGVTSVSSSGLAYGATVTSNGYLQLAYSMGGGTGNTPGLQPGSYSDIFSTQTIDLGAAYPNGNFGANWTEITSAGYYIWYAVSVSSSGQYQTALVNDGYIYISSDYGNTWSAKQTDTNRSWVSVSVSSSGQYQTAVCYAIFISTDYGNTWTQSGTLSASFVAVSSSGQYQTVIADNYIYISSDYGNSFTQKDSSRNWTSISMSSSGQYQTAVAILDYIYISSNYGNTWTAVTSVDPRKWKSVAISSSGQYQTAVVNEYAFEIYGYLYTSSNYGISWEEQNFSGIGWNSVAMTSSGQYQVAVISYNNISSTKLYIYVSSDYGKNWTAATGSGSHTWMSASISSCGQYITAVYSDYAGAINGYISTCYNSPSTKGVLYVGNYTSTSGVTGVAGSLYYDTTDSAMKYSDGNQWNTVGSGSGVTGPTGTSYWSINGSNIYYSSGNVGINDSAPSYALDVSGDGRFTGTLNAAAFNSTSDYRIKESVKRIDENYTIDKLRPVIYLNKQTLKTDMGLIAHELQESYPFLVNGEKDGEEKQSVNYIGLIALLIKEMQETKKEVIHLKKEIKKLQKQE